MFTKETHHHWVFLTHTSFACTQDSQTQLLSGLWWQRQWPLLNYQGPPRRYGTGPGATLQNHLAKRMQAERQPDNTPQRVCTESRTYTNYELNKTQPFICPNKLHKGLSWQGARKGCRNRGRTEGGVGKGTVSPLECSPMTLLCLIQCAISRCIIYFCVQSPTAVTNHYEDEDDGASF